MANKGETKITKRINAAKTVHVKRKQNKFITKTNAGPHPKDKAITLNNVLIDLLDLAKTKKEVKMILNEGKVFVDGKTVKDVAYPIGFMDVVTLPSVNKYFRVIYDHKGRIKLNEIEKSEAGFKLCKIEGKTVISKEKNQLNLHDGKNILTEKTFRVGDVIKISLPAKEVRDTYELKQGNVAYITGGKHAGEIAKITELVPGLATRRPIIKLKEGEKAFETRKDYIFVIGSGEPAIKI